MTKRAPAKAGRNTDFFGIVDGLDLTLQYREKRKSRCEKAKTATASASVSYDFGGSDFAVSGAYTLSTIARGAKSAAPRYGR